MMFSARSLALCCSSSPANRSASGWRVRCRVPLIGRVSTSRSANLQKALGRGADDLELAQVEIAGKRGRIATPQSQVQAPPNRSRAGNNSRCARFTWKMSPAWMYSIARRIARR